MVKIIYIQLVLLLSLSFYSCSGNGKRNNASVVESTVNNSEKAKSMVTELDSKSFISLVGDYTGTEFNYIGKRPCIVDFYATWCGPCKALGPIIDEVSAEYEGKVDFYRIDIDKSEDVAGAFGIQSVPTLIFFPLNGQPRSSVGLIPKETIKEAISMVLDVK